MERRARRRRHGVRFTKGDRNIAPCSDNDSDSVISPRNVHGRMCFPILPIFFILYLYKTTQTPVSTLYIPSLFELFFFIIVVVFDFILTEVLAFSIPQKDGLLQLN